MSTVDVTYFVYSQFVANLSTFFEVRYAPSGYLSLKTRQPFGSGAIGAIKLLLGSGDEEWNDLGERVGIVGDQIARLLTKSVRRTGEPRVIEARVLMNVDSMFLDFVEAGSERVFASGLRLDRSGPFEDNS